MPNQYTKPTRLDWLTNAVQTHNSDDCLIWPFSKHPDGYGSCKFHGRVIHAHRIAFFVAYGHWPVPVGRHTCDNPPCINPRHIVEGTQLQNIADTVSRSRHARGERNSHARLTDEIVRKLRAEYDPKTTNISEIARQYGIDRGSMNRTIHGIYWKHVTDTPRTK